MATVTQICNLALGHLGASKTVANADTENSAEANTFRRFYETVRDATLKDFNWPFATNYAALGLVSTDPTIEWGYAYQYPSDCMNMQRILSGNRNEVVDEMIRFKISRVSGQKVVLSDEPNAVAQYTVKITDPEEFTPDFVLALSFHLAFMMGPHIAKSDTKLIEGAERKYVNYISMAKAQALNEERPDSPPEASYILARER